MKPCPCCAEQIQNDAVKCRFCGEYLTRPGGIVGLLPFTLTGWGWSYEYRSRGSLFGMPLLHVAQGINPSTGLPRVAKGIVAIGNLAIGVVAIGGFTIGCVTLCGIGLGLFALGGISVGMVSVGGIALGGVLAIGGLAVSTINALGGLAIDPNGWESIGPDLRFIERIKCLVP